MGKPSSGFECLSKNPLVFKSDVAVCHAGEVVTDCAVQAGFGDAAMRLSADFLRMLEVEMKQRFKEPQGALVRCMEGFVVVEIFIEIIAQFKVQCAAFGAVLHKRLRKEPDFVG